MITIRDIMEFAGAIAVIALMGWLAKKIFMGGVQWEKMNFTRLHFIFEKQL